MSKEHGGGFSIANRLRAFGAGLLVGALACAVGLLWLALRMGERTRAKRQRYGHDLLEQTAETVEEAMEQARVDARQITHALRKRAEEMEQRGQS